MYIYLYIHNIYLYVQYKYIYKHILYIPTYIYIYSGYGKFSFYFSLMYTQHPILTEKNRNVDMFANLEKKKYHMVISIQTLCSVLSRSTLLS